MERSCTQSGNHLNMTGNLLAATLSVGVIGVGGGVVYVSLVQHELAGAVVLLARHALRLVPPVAWPVIIGAVILWGVVLRREWRSAS
jgi:hypothetical protein